MYGTWCKTHFIPKKLTVKMGNNGRQHPPSLNFCSFSSKAKAEARWIRSCINAHTLQKPYAQHNTLNPYVLWISWLIPWFLEMGLTRISSLVLGGWEIEQPSPEYFLPPVQVPNSEFCKFFKSGLRFPNSALKSLKVYDPHHGWKFWPSSSYSKADMWSFG